jgi:hypothetical protein
MDTMSDDSRLVTPKDEHLVQSTEAMLDYAIIAGAELKNPAFVRLLRLARRSLLRQGRHRPDGTTAEEGAGP